ncbi:MAG: hypothetical protein QXQ29_04140 [Candidatus Bathyarchaeia archaeon]
MDERGEKLLCTSNRTGRRQLYLIDLRDMSMIQLTDDANVRGGCLSYDVRKVY